MCGGYSVITIAKCDETVIDKRFFSILFSKMPQDFCYPMQKLRRSERKFQFFNLSFFCHHAQLKTHSMYMNVLCVKRILYNWSSSFSGLELHLSHDWWAIIQNMHHTRLPRCYFVCTFTNYGEYTSVLHIKPLLYYRRHSFSTLELHASSDW